MTWLWWAVPLSLVVFLWTLNEYLRGSLKRLLSGILALLMFSLVGIACVISGWLAGIGALVGAFALINIFRPFALAVARRLIRFPDLGYEEYNRQKLRRLERAGPGHLLELLNQDMDEEVRHRSASVSSAMQDPAIADVLQQLGATERDLVELYHCFAVHRLPPEIRDIVLRNALLVRFFLENTEPDFCDGRYYRRVPLETSVRLCMWTGSSPGGPEP